MKLNVSSLQNRDFWEKAGISLPDFNISAIRENTSKNPTWIHFGAGNIFRVFLARIYQELLNQGLVDTGMIAAESFDFEIVDRVFKRYDNLTLSVIMKESGELDNTVVASLTDAWRTDRDMPLLVKAFENSSLQIVSYTITEKGYALKDAGGEYFSFVKRDLEKGPDESSHAMSILTSLLYRRFKACASPLAVLSLDNCSHNGDKIKFAVLDIAGHWLEAGFVEKEFVDYLKSEKLAFPLSMIDKITPRPSEKVKKKLEDLGMEDMEIIVTEKNSYTAAFVNAEVCEYLVIEDTFPNGRPALEKAGVLFGNRDTIDNVETMKVTTCLNPLHTALAVTGCLLNYKTIWEEMKDELLVRLVKKIGYDEGLPVVVDPKVLNPADFIDEVVNKRLVNPYIPDAPQRIATDTSQKVGIRYGKTIDAYLKSNQVHNVADLVGIPLAIASWLRYLLGVDDNLEPMELSPDPMLGYLKEKLKDIKISDEKFDIREILENKEIFAHNLYEVGLGDKIEEMFGLMISGKGMVRATLEKYLN